MLSSRERLEARQGQSGTPRHEYLQQLVNEYARSQHWLRKEEIVANLANFAYDPINYAALRQLRVLELFVEIISSHREECNTTQEREEDEDRTAHRGSAVGRERVSRSKRLMVEFAMGGICNCIPDPTLQVAFIAAHGVEEILKIVQRIPVDDHPSAFATALSALTTTYFLLDSPAFADVSSESVMVHLAALSHHSSTRIANIAKAYLSRVEELLANPTIST